MRYIGIIDNDLSKKCKYPNLEAMKLSNYLKNVKRDVVELILDRNDCDKYSEIYYFANDKDKVKDGKFFAQYRSKLHLCGYAFTNGIYKPYSDEIEQSIPDRELYKRFEGSAAFKLNLKRNAVRLQTDNLVITNPSIATVVYDKNAYDYADKLMLLPQNRSIFLAENNITTNWAATLKLCNSEANLSINNRITTGLYLPEIVKIPIDKPLRFCLFYNMFADRSICDTDEWFAKINSYLDDIIRLAKLNIYPVDEFMGKNAFFYIEFSRLLRYKTMKRYRDFTKMFNSIVITHRYYQNWLEKLYQVVENRNE